MTGRPKPDLSDVPSLAELRPFLSAHNGDMAPLATKVRARTGLYTCEAALIADFLEGKWTPPTKAEVGRQKKQQLYQEIAFKLDELVKENGLQTKAAVAELMSLYGVSRALVFDILQKYRPQLVSEPRGIRNLAQAYREAVGGPPRAPLVRVQNKK